MFFIYKIETNNCILILLKLLNMDREIMDEQEYAYYESVQQDLEKMFEKEKKEREQKEIELKMELALDQKRKETDIAIQKDKELREREAYEDRKPSVNELRQLRLKFYS